jgi:hypothetical protein
MDEFTSFDSPKRKLPNATIVLILGISSIPLCCCFGGIVGALLGIVGLVLAKKDFALYDADPSLYTDSSYNNVKAGRICSIIGLVISGIYLLLFIWMISTFGWEAASNPQVIQEYFENMKPQ